PLTHPSPSTSYSLSLHDALPIYLRVLALTISAALLTGILFGLAPALRASCQDPASILQQSVRSVARGAGKLGKTLVVSQVAVSLDRKSTRLNSSHVSISYAVFCL